MKKSFALGLLVFLLSGCNKSAPGIETCIKGKYLGTYCDGAVIQIMEAGVKGRDWKGIHSGYDYKNSIVASFDSTVFGNLVEPDPLNTKSDSIFYFRYRNGGYPRPTFDICEPSPFVTIIHVSDRPCR